MTDSYLSLLVICKSLVSSVLECYVREEKHIFGRALSYGITVT